LIYNPEDDKRNVKRNVRKLSLLYPAQQGSSILPLISFLIFSQNYTKYREKFKIFALPKSRHPISKVSLSQLTSHHVLTSLDTNYWSTTAGSTVHRRYNVTPKVLQDQMD